MKQCKSCSEPFEPKQKFNSTIKTNRCDVCLKTAQALKNLASIKKEKKAKQKEDLLTLQDYLKLAQAVFNKWIRQRDRGLNCISCDNPCKKENAGHYFSSGAHANVRFNENNVHLQCEYCNTFLHGNLIEYGVNLEKKIGKDEFTILREKAYLTKKFTKDELKELLLKYKEKIKDDL